VLIKEPVSSLELTYGEDERVKQKGADNSVVKKKARKKSMIQEQKKTGKHQDLEKLRRKKQRAVCSGIKDR